MLLHFQICHFMLLPYAYLLPSSDYHQWYSSGISVPENVGKPFQILLAHCYLKSGRFTVYTVHKLMHLPVLSCHMCYLRGARHILILRIPCSALRSRKVTEALLLTSCRGTTAAKIGAWGIFVPLPITM